MHIVFDEEDAKALAVSFELDETLASKVVVVSDDWSIGPLNQDEAGEDGAAERSKWLAQVYEKNIPADNRYLDEIRSALNENPEEEVLIWIAPNSRDVAGYYYLVSELTDCKGRLSTIWLNNLPFINEKGMIFYPSFLREIPAKEFLKAQRLATEISLSTFETDPDEWKRMVSENSVLRVLESHKKIISRDGDFFDKQILALLHNDFQKTSRLATIFNTKTKHYINPQFFIWRLRELINGGLIEAKGDWPTQNIFEVRKFQVNPNPKAS